MKRVTVYTDGACSGNPGPGGYGAILIYNGVEKEISGSEDNTTNNRMELMGPIKALEILKEACIVDIYSDSSYVVDSFNEGWIYNWEKNGWKRGKNQEVKNVDLLKDLLELTRKHKVTWHKVKGHSDNEYNNRCDNLAVSSWQELKKQKRTQLYEGDLIEKILKEESIFNGRVFDVKKYEVELVDGTISQREIVVHNGGVCVIPITQDGYVYMVRQYRLALEDECLEIPAGKLEQGEDPLACAIRELKEETGLSAKKLDHILSFCPSPGYVTELLHIYIARGLEQGDANYDIGEYLHVEKHKLEDLLKMVEARQIRDGKTIIGLFYCQMNWGKLNEDL